jgi:nicotinate-nucleotide pyrophosphorylase (carboxylating)
MGTMDITLDRDLIVRALAEDIGRGDATTLACVPATTEARGRIITRRAGVIAGLPVAVEVFRQVDDRIQIQTVASDGDHVAAGDEIAVLRGPARGILTGERVALNFLGRLSGIATLTAHCVAATEGTRARIVDTRKTTPGLRALEKYAVRVGGGGNHRFGLDDGILIKDNHIIASGGVTQAIQNARAHAHHLLRLEVECDTLDQVREALDAQAEAILLDNMAPDALRAAVAVIRAARPATIIEASGNVGTDPAKIQAVAETGVDLISIGALTHSAANLDLSLEFTASE